MPQITAISLPDAAANFRDDLVRIIRASLGLPDSVAVPMADELAKAMKKEMGGMYIPAREIRDVRDAAVRRDFNGRNRDEVMRIHKITRRTFYRIIGRR
jgi:Mor family transcriptional regulator